MTQFPHLSHEWFGLDRGPSQHILDGGLHRNHLEKYFKIQIPGPILWKICFTVGGGDGAWETIFYFLKFLFIYFIYWLHWVFVAARRLFSPVASSKGYSSLQCAGFSLRWLLLLWSTGSRRTSFSSCGAWSLEHRLSSCGARA